MDTGEDIINNQRYRGTLRSCNNYITFIRNKLWEEGKIKIDGYSYEEWKKEREI